MKEKVKPKTIDSYFNTELRYYKKLTSHIQTINKIIKKLDSTNPNEIFTCYSKSDASNSAQNFSLNSFTLNKAFLDIIEQSFALFFEDGISKENLDSLIQEDFYLLFTCRVITKYLLEQTGGKSRDSEDNTDYENQIKALIMDMSSFISDNYKSEVIENKEKYKITFCNEMTRYSIPFQLTPVCSILYYMQYDRYKGRNFNKFINKNYFAHNAKKLYSGDTVINYIRFMLELNMDDDNTQELKEYFKFSTGAKNVNIYLLNEFYGVIDDCMIMSGYYYRAEEYLRNKSDAVIRKEELYNNIHMYWIMFVKLYAELITKNKSADGFQACEEIRKNASVYQLAYIKWVIENYQDIPKEEVEQHLELVDGADELFSNDKSMKHFNELPELLNKNELEPSTAYECYCSFMAIRSQNKLPTELDSDMKASLITCLKEIINTYYSQAKPSEMLKSLLEDAKELLSNPQGVDCNSLRNETVKKEVSSFIMRLSGNARDTLQYSLLPAKSHFIKHVIIKEIEENASILEEYSLVDSCIDIFDKILECVDAGIESSICDFQKQYNSNMKSSYNNIIECVLNAYSETKPHALLLQPSEQIHGESQGTDEHDYMQIEDEYRLFAELHRALNYHYDNKSYTRINGENRLKDSNCVKYHSKIGLFR